MVRNECKLALINANHKTWDVGLPRNQLNYANKTMLKVTVIANDFTLTSNLL